MVNGRGGGGGGAGRLKQIWLLRDKRLSPHGKPRVQPDGSLWKKRRKRARLLVVAGSIVLAKRQRSAGDMQGSHLATYPAARVCGWGRALMQQGRGKREGAE